MVLAIDLGGTKLATALMSNSGTVVKKDTFPLAHRTGAAVGKLICDAVAENIRIAESRPEAIGVSVPGIARRKTGTVWAPNIPGWEDYPLVAEIRSAAGAIPVSMDSDRACCMLGELWLGNARGCNDAIYMAVGTGIGAGILVDGRILRGAHDIAGSVGWMALSPPFQQKYVQCGCFEYFASGDGIAKLTRDMLSTEKDYKGALRQGNAALITAHDVFEAYDKGDGLAKAVFDLCIQYWGMATANLVSIFNPEKVIFGGGVFGPALRFVTPIQEEARKWAQPVSITKVTFEPSALHGDAAIYGAAFLATKTAL